MRSLISTDRTDQSLKDEIDQNESWAFYCAFAVICGLIIEVILELCFHEPSDTFLNRWRSIAAFFYEPSEKFINRWGAVIADVIVALGVAGEVFFGRRARIASEELSRRAEEKLGVAMKRAAEADARAAEARERTAEIERFTAWRRVTPHQAAQVADEIRNLAASLDILIEYQNGDAEVYSYFLNISDIFNRAGVEKFRYRPNMFLTYSVFGLHIASSKEADANLISRVFLNHQIPINIFGKNLSEIFPSEVTPPNLYIFIGPKPPASNLGDQADIANRSAREPDV